ncbi:nuclear transport factor 2 family protein [Antarcticirhabdus aurantiaca]|uniref:Nuclear transport factor 2 family protein n=1 Tax=Antarcticirhabdus aurantiaca TaxID=2606717 RepID=A0ACD4NH28_9HYPH|nr:nuclear transport factor 2 family protein [Antarcticirhabdus aurantiaca]WAJ26106.1 nuclear transport factor 2 family protein [Jeongeuplla avenae]
MTTPHNIADDYLDVWNEADLAERDRWLKTWHPDVRYRDPLMQSDGRDGVAAMIEGARRQFPGLTFHLRGAPDGHGPFVRFSWTLGPEAGPAVAGGTDIVRLDGDERVAEVIGFLDEAVS